MSLIKINIKEEEEYLEIEIRQRKKSMLKIILQIVLSLVSGILLIICVLTSPLVLAFPIFFFFTIFFLSFRSLLWQINGKEKIKITPSIVNQVIDYGLFKYNTKISNDNVDLEIDLQKLLKGASEEILDSDLEKYQRNGIIRFKKNRDVMISIEAVIPSIELEEIEKLIQAHLK